MESLPPHVKVSPKVLFQELDGEAVLLDLQTQRYYGLDDVATRAWKLLAEHGDVETVCARLLAEYRVEEERLRRDLGELIATLARAGLVCQEAPGGSSAGAA